MHLAISNLPPNIGHMHVRFHQNMPARLVAFHKTTILITLSVLLPPNSSGIPPSCADEVVHGGFCWPGECLDFRKSFLGLLPICENSVMRTGPCTNMGLRSMAKCVRTTLDICGLFKGPRWRCPKRPKR